MKKEGASNSEIAEEIGFSAKTVSAFLQREADEAKMRDDRERERDPMAYFQRQALNEVYGDPDIEAKVKAGLRRKIIKSLDDNDLTGWQAAVAAILREAAPHLGPVMPRLAMGLTHDKDGLLNEIQARDNYIAQLEARIRQDHPELAEEPPKQLAAPADSEAPPPPSENGHAPAEPFDLSTALVRWIGMSPSVAAAEARAQITEPDAPLRPPVFMLSWRQITALSAEDLHKLLTNHPVFRLVPPPAEVVQFLETDQGRAYWPQFTAGLGLG